MITMTDKSEQTLFFTSFEKDEWALPMSIPVDKFCRNMRAFSLETSSGPKEVWNNLPNVGWSGERCLHVCGTHSSSGSASAMHVLFDSLHLTVDDDTRLSYLIFPVVAKGEFYDKQDTAMHIAVSLRFDDGSYLHDLNLKDKNGSVFTPRGQGEGRTLYANQWNEVEVSLKSVRGKTVTQILIGYEMAENEGGLDLEFNAYIDDLRIYNRPAAPAHDALDYVNILRGTNDNGNYSRGLTVPAVSVPFGAQFWCPANTDNGDEIYKYQPNGEFKKLRHITVSHEPSKWIGDRGTWQFMVNTSFNIDAVNKASRISASSRASLFSHKDETAKPDFYRVLFRKGAAGGSAMEFTPTSHALSVQFRFSRNATHHNVIFDSVNAPGKIVIGADNRSFSCYTDHCSGGMKRMYVYGTFNIPINKYKIFGKSAILNFGTETTVEMRVATSFISPSQAKHNLMLETSGKSHSALRARAHRLWLDKLNRIEIEGATEEQLITFYSCMYRLFLYPNLLSENVGSNEEPDWKYASPYSSSVKKASVKSGKLYYNNGFWDTYRTVWPALALLAPSIDSELLTGFTEHYNDCGWVPRWIAPGGHNCMVGTNSDTVFAEAMIKNISFPHNKAYESAIKNGSVFPENLVNGGRKGIEQSIFKGYTTSKICEGLSWSMEGYINDFGIARMADALGDGDASFYYRNRSLQYAALFSKFKGGWFRGKTYSETRRSRAANRLDSLTQTLSLGNWEASKRGIKKKYTHEKYDNSRQRLYSAVNKLCDALPKADKELTHADFNQIDTFDPTVWGGDYTETNAWNMAFSVPHDGKGLINLYGGNSEFIKKLDEFFSYDRTDLKVGSYGRIIHEMAEAREIRLGQYGHSNQPSHHIPYMYNYAGKPSRTAEIVRDVLRRCYVGSSIGQGYCGDEDNGEMSAWYIFSALGFYPLSPASGTYTIGSPLFRKATIHLENGADLVLNAPENNDKNIYVRNLRLNGQIVSRNFLRHSEIARGGVIEFVMGDTPSNWGTDEYDCPPCVTTTNEAPNPVYDLTTPDTVTLSEPPTVHTVGNSAYCAGKKLNALFDDHSQTFVRLPLTNGRVSLYYHFDKDVTLQMYTLTSSNRNESAPIRMTLYGFDGNTWIELDHRDSVYFKWKRYTKPFLVLPENRGTYKFYRLDMDGAEDYIELSEVELLGRE